VYEVEDKLAGARVVAEEIVAAIERGQKRFEDLPPTWLTVEQAATYLNVSPDTVERLASSGKLRSSEVKTDRSKGRRATRRIRREWLDEFMEANRTVPPPPPPVDPATRRRRPKGDWKSYIK
jgi:excisionase family DNA binding protein